MLAQATESMAQLWKERPVLRFISHSFFFLSLSGKNGLFSTNLQLFAFGTGKTSSQSDPTRPLKSPVAGGPARAPRAPLAWPRLWAAARRSRRPSRPTSPSSSPSLSPSVPLRPFRPPRHRPFPSPPSPPSPPPASGAALTVFVSAGAMALATLLRRCGREAGGAPQWYWCRRRCPLAALPGRPLA
jgi:hypothetical protein